jgi:hypothetical protein
MSKTVAQGVWYRMIIDDPRLAMPNGFYLLVETALRHGPPPILWTPGLVDLF